MDRVDLSKLQEDERDSNTSYLILYIFNIFLITLATLCFLRLTSSLPLILSDEYLLRFSQNPHYDSKKQIFFGIYGIWNVSGGMVILFLVYPFILTLLGTDIRLFNITVAYKKIWLKVIVCWGVFFTIFSTIAILWGA